MPNRTLSTKNILCEDKTQLGDLTITADTLSLQMLVRQVTQPWRRRMLGALVAVGLAQGWNGTLVRKGGRRSIFFEMLPMFSFGPDFIRLPLVNFQSGLS